MGEYVLPQQKPVWTSTFVSALALLGIEEKAARQALGRTNAQGLIKSTRSGRRASWELTPYGRTVLSEGTERIYGFLRQRRPWDGRWLVLSIPIPETHRQLRQRLATRLTWLGLGTPTAGLWITPHTERMTDVQGVLDELQVNEQADAWAGASLGPDRGGNLIARAWQMEDVATHYRKFLSDYRDAAPPTDRDVFVTQVQMIQSWRRFPFIDPDLPAELLSGDWPGSQAANVFHRQHARWHLTAQSVWRNLVGSA